MVHKILQCSKILAVVTTSIMSLQAQYTTKILTGKGIEEIIPFFAELRLLVFRQNPYLYEGSMEEETEHLNLFATMKDSAIAVAYYNNKPVAFVMGASFIAYNDRLNGSIELFNKAALNPDAFYYFSEEIVLPEHRNKGLIKRLYGKLENHAKEHGYFSGCFVETHKHHTYYHKPTVTSKKSGYQKTLLVLSFEWTTKQLNGPEKNESLLLTYWIKNFN